MEGRQCNFYEKFQDHGIINRNKIIEQFKLSCLFCEQEMEKGGSEFIFLKKLR